MKQSANAVLPMMDSLGVAIADASSTLTPTTLRKITDILESDECLQNIQKVEEGGDIVLPDTTTTNVSTTRPNRTFVSNSSSNSWQGGVTTVVTPNKTIPLLEVFMDHHNNSEPDTEDCDYHVEEETAPNTRRSTRLARNGSARIVNSIAVASRSSPSPRPVSKAKRSGRKPANFQSDDDLSPEEEQRLRLRRQRNKEAAARCRKRRVDLTNTLMIQVEEHERKRQELEEQIRQLKGQKEELEFILDAHRQGNCSLMGPPAKKMVLAVKSEPVVVQANSAPFTTPDIIKQFIDSDFEEAKPKRPASLSLAVSMSRPIDLGVAIETPSSIMTSLSFDTMSTGLTPSAAPVVHFVTSSTSLVTPTLTTPTNCSSQQRSTENLTEISSSPDYVTL